jgi:hypothetical protein
VAASHIYVRHLPEPDGRGPVVRLDDPVTADGRPVPGGWWPPLMLEPGWVSDNHQRFDVFQVHFGFDANSPEVLTDVVQELKMHDKPLVYTVHDLRNPHHREPGAHAEQQDVPLAAAHTVITLTPGAARAIRRRWNRSGHVLPTRTCSAALGSTAHVTAASASSSVCTPRVCVPTWTRSRSSTPSVRWSQCYPARCCGSTSTTRSSTPVTTGSHPKWAKRY